MVSRIDRYVIKEVALTLVATVLVLLAVMLTNRFAQFLNQAASGLLTREAIFLLLGLQCIRFINVLTPPAFMLAIMLALGRLYRDNEMTALAACGLGPGGVYRPLFMLALPLALLVAVLSLYVVPMAMDLQQVLQLRAREEAQVSVLTPGSFREADGGRLVVYAGGIAQGGRELQKVFIQTRDDNGVAITTGNRGHLELHHDTGARYLVLDDGHRYQGRPGQRDFRNMKFERLTVRVESAAAERSWVRREAVPTAELLATDTPSAKAEIHERLSSPLALLLIAFVAPLLARANPREGRFGRVVMAILVYVIYMNLLGVGESWLTHGVTWPALGLWWVHALLALFGAAVWYFQYGRSHLAARRRQVRP
ncbi:MAG: LPS export ABC transporter permease LptF [Pseudomonadota bacterium]|nr:LPS export ABC transporter permease LptF [Pseudomonadota bacterium]